MIPFFRKIRKKMADDNRPLKYSRYAIGEIILVVIGILIALQINNWNEQRKAKVKEAALLLNLTQDLRSDSISFSRNFNILSDIISLHGKLYEIGVNNNIDIIIDNPNDIRRSLYYNPITRENDPFVASKISNDLIRKEVLNYFRYMNDMDNSYAEFVEVVHNEMRVLLRKNELHDLSGWFGRQKEHRYDKISNNIIHQQDLIELSKQGEFQQLLLEASIKGTESLDGLKALIEQNNKLKETILLELRK